MALYYGDSQKEQTEIQYKPKDPTLVLEKLDILHETVMIFKNLKDNVRLVTRNIFTGKVKIKETGFRWKLPLIKKAYILDKGRYILEVRDPKSSDGRYSQDIGLGNDIKLTLNVSIEASDKPKYVAKLLKQQKTYVHAIRYATERIMRAIVADKYQVTEELEKLDIDKLRNTIQKTFNLDIQDVIDGKAKVSQECSREIIKITTDLLANYGIKIVDIHFPDVDLPKEITDMINKSLAEATQRKIDIANAERDVIVAEKEAETLKTKRLAEITLLKDMKEKLNLSEEQVARFINFNAMNPASTVAFIGNENTNTSDYLIANMASQNQKKTGKFSR